MQRTPSTPAPFSGAFVFFSMFGLYLFNLAPTVTFWDSGELITAACSLGIPHQPGYPLFCNVGRLFSLVPLANAAFRLNLLSAFFSALAVWTVYRTVLALFRAETQTACHEQLVAASIALALGVAGIFWSQAVVTEVYALGGFFVALLLYMHVLAVSGGLAPGRYLALSGFVFGLGVINHVSLVLYLPALLLSWAAAAGRGAGVRGYASGVFFILLGLSVYVYLPLRSAAGPGLDIGHPDGWTNFLWTVKWGAYAESAWGLMRAGPGLIGRLDLADWRVLAGIFALAAAAWLLLRKSPRLYLAPAVFLVVYVAVVSVEVLGSARDIRFGLPPKFYIPALITAAVLAGGLARQVIYSGRGTGGPMRCLVAAVFAVTALTAAVHNHHRYDYSKNYIAFDYAVNSLKSVGERGVLVTWGDNGVFPLWYLRTVERYRDDTVLAHGPLLTYGWYLNDVERWMGKDVNFASPYFLGENVYRLFKAAGPARPFCYDYSSTTNLKLDEKTLTLFGLVYYEGPAPKGDPWPWYVFRGVDDPDVFKGPMDSNIIQIYRYQARLSARFPAALFDRP